MDIFKKIFYTVTYPFWYLLARLMGHNGGPPAIEPEDSGEATRNEVAATTNTDSGETESSDGFKLAALERFDADEWSRSAQQVHESATAKANELFDEIKTNIAEATIHLSQKVEKIVNENCPAEDLPPAEFPLAEAAEESDNNDSSYAGDSLENLETDEDYLPESVKKATEELQREIEQTMKLRDQLREAAEQGQRHVEEIAEKAQKIAQDVVNEGGEAARAAAEATQKAAAQAADQTRQEMERVAEAAREAARRAFADTRQAAAEAGDRLSAAFDDTAQRAAHDLGDTLASAGSKVEELGEAGRSLRNSIDSVVRSSQDGVKRRLDTLQDKLSNQDLDKETQDRLAAVGQAISDETESSFVQLDSK